MTPDRTPSPVTPDAIPHAREWVKAIGIALMGCVVLGLMWAVLP